MTEALYVLTVGLVYFLYWLEKKKIEYFPEEFSLTRFLKGNKDTDAIGPDPSADQVQSRLDKKCKQKPRNKLKPPSTCEEMIADSKTDAHFNAKKWVILMI